MSGCGSPLSLDTLVAYWAGDLDHASADEVEAHVFACATCTKVAERIAAITETLRALVPPVIGPGRLAALRAAGRRIEDQSISPGERVEIVFDRQELLVFHLGGLDLRDVEHVDVVVRVESTGEVISEIPRAPFDAENGEVLIACQRHFAAFPRDVAFEIRAVASGGATQTARYVAIHHFAGA